MNNAVTATAATIARPALDDQVLVEASVEFVARLSAVRFSETDLRHDAADPNLEQEIRGSLLLLREDLADSARLALIDAVDELGRASYSIDARYAANWCSKVLGANDHPEPVRQRRFALLRR